MTQTNLFTKQKQTYGYQSGEEGWWDKLGVWDEHIYYMINYYM